MKHIKKLIITGTLSLIIVLGIAQAQESATFEISSSAYTAPQLINSVTPDPVSYAPGRIVEGYVTLELKVSENGTVDAVKVLYRTSPLAVKSAVRALEQWKFEPAYFNGKPVTSYVAYSLPFGNNLQIFANDNYTDRVLDPDSGTQVAIK
ncbi:TonB family protein [bacterium]|nr:TonB family protein [bacterium]MBU1652533.1 TonB family protein [bacterium]MBU1882265.1 TonB family protein [bacterium]